MLKSSGSATELHAKVDKVVQRWLHERQELIVLMCAINGLKEFTPNDVPTSTKIQAFCQVLMDYVSAGHFEVYDELLKEAEVSHSPNIARAQKIYPHLTLSTEATLRFNDLYDTDEHCEELLASLPHELSELGLSLEERFELEDQLISLLHTRQPAAEAVA